MNRQSEEFPWSSRGRSALEKHERLFEVWWRSRLIYVGAGCARAYPSGYWPSSVWTRGQLYYSFLIATWLPTTIGNVYPSAIFNNSAFCCRVRLHNRIPVKIGLHKWHIHIHHYIVMCSKFEFSFQTVFSPLTGSLRSSLWCVLFVVKIKSTARFNTNSACWSFSLSAGQWRKVGCCWRWKLRWRKQSGTRCPGTKTPGRASHHCQELCSYPW